MPAQPVLSQMSAEGTAAAGQTSVAVRTMLNSGNSCYVNSTLQALAALNTGHFAFESLQSLLDLCASHLSDARPLNPTGLFQLRSLLPRWRFDGRQQDASEFYTALTSQGVGDLQAVQWQGRTDGHIEAADVGESPYKVRAGVFHIGAEVTSGDDAVRPTPASASDTKRVKVTSPDAKRPRGSRSPVPEDADMTDKPQLKIPEMRGASGRGSGGSGDRNSALRAAPARRITALSPEELTQGFLLHEEQLALQVPLPTKLGRRLVVALFGLAIHIQLVALE
ncbi:hypothetical protein AK812_SmicGene7610 [Symbiodinium microadriaticum]|uniref:USP domain-containing protein n=1 Tax=Symbiodinium microadriaticum TaxID=2951 RepID=A0A1Q9EN60_SYMMI|nr:hypothetical protein AK812_SmicGene7610 [Symbiodinium microadriaticum]